jgi:hypothetical protein
VNKNSKRKKIKFKKKTGTDEVLRIFECVELKFGFVFNLVQLISFFFASFFLTPQKQQMQLVPQQIVTAETLEEFILSPCCIHVQRLLDETRFRTLLAMRLGYVFANHATAKMMEDNSESLLLVDGHMPCNSGESVIMFHVHLSDQGVTVQTEIQLVELEESREYGLLLSQFEIPNDGISSDNWSSVDIALISACKKRWALWAKVVFVHITETLRKHMKGVSGQMWNEKVDIYPLGSFTPIVVDAIIAGIASGVRNTLDDIEDDEDGFLRFNIVPTPI